ncbi:MAG: glycosyltransferase [Terracidiphilus sp.]|jgi:glycosyltransferase involved in cell wall biosynthesis
MRIVTVLTSLGVGGAEKQALAVAERMAARGHDVALLVLRPRLPEQWPTTLPVVHLDIRKSDPVSVGSGFRRGRHFLHDFRPDVVHSHSFHANILARLLQFGAPRRVVISTVHNVYEGGWMRMLAYRLTDRWSQRTVAVSQAAADRFVRLKAIPKRKCSVRTNGIDTQEFAPDAARRTSTRISMGADSSFVWLSAGRITPAKDFPNLLAAFQQVRREAPDAELWIAGAPADAKLVVAADGTSRHYFGMAGEKGFLEHVRWLGLRRDMPALLDAADGFVLGSAWEGMPLVLGEAMAMEKPVVATDVGGVRELVGDQGMLVPAKDPEPLAEAMQASMRQSREERAQLGCAARGRIVGQFSIDAAADWWEALYNREHGTGNRE